MKHSILIIGAGLSGMLAASRFYGRCHVLERQSEDRPPWKGGTFYSHARIPKWAEEELMVVTGVAGLGKASIEQAADAYAEKVYGKVQRCSLHNFDQRVTVERRWQWDTQGLHDHTSSLVSWNCEVKKIDTVTKKVKAWVSGREVVYEYDHLISTIPLPIFLRLIDREHLLCSGRPTFNASPIYLTHADGQPLPDGMMAVTYHPFSPFPFYRTTHIGNKVTTEWIEDPSSGSYPVPHTPDVVLRPGKIFPELRSIEIVDALRERNVWCIGRYAQWLPKLLSNETCAYLRTLDF